jgi:hypothetical protein
LHPGAGLLKRMLQIPKQLFAFPPDGLGVDLSTCMPERKQSDP